MSQHLFKSDPAVLNHPTIRRFLESPSRSSSPLNQGSETPSLVHSDFESLSQQGDAAERDGEGVWRDDRGKQECRPARNTGKVGSCQERRDGVFIVFGTKKIKIETLHNLSQDTFGVPSTVGAEQRVTYHTSGSESSRLYAKKTIVVGNVSKYVFITV